jgi:hypothetical protein
MQRRSNRFVIATTGQRYDRRIIVVRNVTIIPAEPVTKDDVMVKSAQRASLTNSRGRAFAVDYRALQKTVQTVPMETIGVNKRTLRPAPTAFGAEVIPRFLCIAAAEVGDLFEDAVPVFFKPWEDRVRESLANKGTLDLAKLERLLNAEVARSARQRWVEIEKINVRRPVPMLARSFALFWMRMFFEEVDAIIGKCVV